MQKYFTMGSNKNPVTVNPMIHNFGDEGSSDVTFVIGTEEFKCHKKLLSERSSYFNALFNSGFKEKDQSRVFIHEDPIGFEMILDILYMERCYFVNDRCCKRSSTYRSDACTCKRRRRARRRPRFSCCISYNLWSQYTMLLRLTDKYDILDDIAKLIEDGFVEYDRLWLKDPFCICDGIKHLIATFFHMEKFRATRPVPLDCLGEVLTVMTDFQPDLQFEMGHLEWLLGDQLNKKSSIVLCDMDTDTLSKPIFHNFGVEELSDVTFVVGEEQFKCHKMFLAARSSHFKEMFFNASKIASDFVHLNGDAVVFGQLMEILYNGSFVEWREAVCCQGLDKEKDSMSTCPVIPKLWKTCSSLVKLADNFAVKDHVIAILDNYFMRSKGCTPRSKICICDGAKYIFASVHGLHEYKNTFSVTRDIVARAAGVIKKCDPQLSIDIDTFYSILSNISNTL